MSSHLQLPLFLATVAPSLLFLSALHWTHHPGNPREVPRFLSHGFCSCLHFPYPLSLQQPLPTLLCLTGYPHTLPQPVCACAAPHQSPTCPDAPFPSPCALSLCFTGHSNPLVHPLSAHLHLDGTRHPCTLAQLVAATYLSAGLLASHLGIGSSYWLLH